MAERGGGGLNSGLVVGGQVAHVYLYRSFEGVDVVWGGRGDELDVLLFGIVEVVFSVREWVVCVVCAVRVVHTIVIQVVYGVVVG